MLDPWESVSPEKAPRRNCIPFIYTKGTHYEIGYDVGRTFRHVIQSFLDVNRPLNRIYLPIYETPEGRQAYELTLSNVKKNFPQYVEEIQGTADGANVPFYKLFLLHMDEITQKPQENKMTESCSGCSTIYCSNSQERYIAHNEDALGETLSHFYFVSAHVVKSEPKGRWKVTEEKFTSLCYAGMLPGFTMSYNQHGLVYTVNVIRVLNMQAGKTPRTILARAMLAAENLDQVRAILKDEGTGIADGVTMNLTFLNDPKQVFYNIEVGPSDPPNSDSLMDLIEVNPKEHYYHCNRYLRLKCRESEWPLKASSQHRENTLNSHPEPKSPTDLANMLGDESDTKFPVFRTKGVTYTIVTGIINLTKRTLTLFTDNPKKNEPLMEIPMVL